jgi:hypothetical protein
MNIIDSSFRLEYFAGTESGDIVAEIVENQNELIVPTITLYEVFKKLLFEKIINYLWLIVLFMQQI